MRLETRLAAPSDGDALYALLPELGYPGGSRAMFDATLARVLGDPTQRLWVAVGGASAERIVGMVAVTMRPQLRLGGLLVTVDELVVTADARGRGVGGALIARVVREADAVGARRVELHTQRARESYQRGFYAKHGFDEIESAVLRLRR